MLLIRAMSIPLQSGPSYERSNRDRRASGPVRSWRRAAAWVQVVPKAIGVSFCRVATSSCIPINTCQPLMFAGALPVLILRLPPLISAIDRNALSPNVSAYMLPGDLHIIRAACQPPLPITLTSALGACGTATAAIPTPL